MIYGNQNFKKDVAKSSQKIFPAATFSNGWSGEGNKILILAW
jgi:hypothetical protein